MANRAATLPLLFAAFLGIGRALQPAPAPAPAAQVVEKTRTGDPTPQPSKKEVKPFPTGVHLVREYLHADRGTGVPDSLPSLGVVIATLPDPTDTHLDWAFDSYFEATLRAYERAGYVMDRYWLPWTEKFDTLVAADSGFVARRVREEYPGVVLFRRDTVAVQHPVVTRGTGVPAPAIRGGNGPGLRVPRPAIPVRAAAAMPTVPPLPELQLLYIVGERSSAGVHKAAFRRALQERQALLRNAPGADSVVRLVGPSLSGSARSLVAVLSEWRTAARHTDSVKIVTGSATSPDNAAMLRTLPGASFGSTVHSDSLLTLALAWKVLCPLQIPDDKVVILRESGTAYGRGAVPEHMWIGCPGQRRVYPDRFLVVPFPMNIATLRSQSEVNAPKDEAAGQADQRVELSLRDPDRPMDRPAPASALTAPTLEVLLDEIEQTITERGIRAVGILASDVRDKLFLAKELRGRLRDVQLFTFEANALFLVPENNEELRGMLVVSTYPLSLRTQWLTPGRLGGMRLSFPNEGAMGIHNAVLMQLGAGRMAAGYALPLLRQSADHTPPVWISAVGRHALLPVTVDTSHERTYMEPMEAGATLPGDPLSIQFFTAASLILLSALLLHAVRRLLPFRPAPAVGEVRTPPAGAEREEILDEVRWGSQNLHEFLYGSLRILSLLSVYVPITVVAAAMFLRHPSSESERTSAGQWLLLGWLVIVLGAGLYAAARYTWGALLRFRAVLPLGTQYARNGWRENRPGQVFWWVEIVVRGLIILAGASFFASAVWLTAQIVRISRLPITFPLFVHRAGELNGGVSPLLTLLLAAAGFAAWCTWHERRIAMLRDTTPFEAAWVSRESATGAPTTATALPLAATYWVQQVRARLFLVVPTPPGIALLLGIVVLAVVLNAQFSRTIEGMISLTAFDVLLRFSIVGSLVATCWAVYRLLSVWQALDRVLMHLGQTPLGPAFRRLPERVAQLTRLTLWRPPSREVVEMVSASQWRGLHQLYRLAQPDFDALDQKYPELEIAGFMRENAPVPPSRLRRRLVEGNHDSFVRLDRILSKLWETEPDSDVVNDIRSGALGKSHDVNTSVLFRQAFPGGVRLWLRAAEEFAAVQVVDYIEWVLQSLRTLALFLFITLLLTTALISSYPFQPQGLVKLVFLFVLLGTVSAILYVMAAMNRDDVLSMIANTDAGRLTWDRTFILNAVAVGVVPLLTLISSEVPGLRTILFAWVQPILSGLSGG